MEFGWDQSCFRQNGGTNFSRNPSPDLQRDSVGFTRFWSLVRFHCALRIRHCALRIRQSGRESGLRQCGSQKFPKTEISPVQSRWIHLLCTGDISVFGNFWDPHWRSPDSLPDCLILRAQCLILRAQWKRTKLQNLVNPTESRCKSGDGFLEKFVPPFCLKHD